MSLRLMFVTGLMWILTACGPTVAVAPSKSTDTRSTSFATDAEKVAFLKQYVAMPTTVRQAEFHVVYHDNSAGLVPGPSDWDIQAVMRVAPDDVARWTDGMQAVERSVVDLAWAETLLQQAGWNVSGDPLVYERSGALLAAFRQDGVVAQREWTIP